MSTCLPDVTWCVPEKQGWMGLGIAGQLGPTLFSFQVRLGFDSREKNIQREKKPKCSWCCQNRKPPTTADAQFAMDHCREVNTSTLLLREAKANVSGKRSNQAAHLPPRNTSIVKPEQYREACYGVPYQQQGLLPWVLSECCFVVELWVLTRQGDFE